MDFQLLTFVAIGFLAQMVDGALGMAFGVIASTSLMAAGAPPAVASAAVHAAEIVTTGISGASHIWNKNVDRTLFLKLGVTGICGGVLGAYVLTGLPEHLSSRSSRCTWPRWPVLSLLEILEWKLRRWQPPTPVIGAGGGFLDAIGGGGWGPLVASTLIAGGNTPRRAVGSVNLAEFFITASVSVAFLMQLDLAQYGKLVIGLIIGGGLAAPLAGYLLRVLPTRLVLVLVSIVIAALSVINLVGVFV